MICIKDIQNWEKEFVKKKKLPSSEAEQTRIALSKLIEEVAEVVKAVLASEWDEVQAEVSDVIIFACKVANIAEDFHDAEELEDVIRKKIDYSETREIDTNRGLDKLDKPKSDEFK